MGRRFFVPARLSRERAEAWYPMGINSATSHKGSRILTQPGRKSGVPSSAVLVSGRARPFTRHHTRPHRRLRRAVPCEQRALERGHFSVEDIAAPASRVLPQLFHGKRDRFLRIEGGIRGPYLQAAPRDDPDAPPFDVAGGKDLRHDLL